MTRARIVAIAVAIAVGGCTRDPVTHADDVVADDARAPTPTPSSTLDAAPSSVTSASAAPGPRPLTMDEVADRCGHKGDLICCLGPPIAGPPPKPYCYPAQ